VPDPSALAVFALAAFVLLVVPGPAVLYIVAQSVGRGRLAGVVSVLGVQVGALVHVTAAAVGLSALVVQSALAFGVVKYAGAAYLVYLGACRLLGRGESAAAGAQRERSLWALFRQGVVVNTLNPKTALFFFAFLPQFVDVSKGYVALQIGLLGGVFIAIALVSDGAYALVSGSAAGRLRGRRGALRAERYVSGSVLVGLGLATALTGERRAAAG
jgi:threonine/homoserine/homoserine lactone efflux protein